MPFDKLLSSYDSLMDKRRKAFEEKTQKELDGFDLKYKEILEFSNDEIDRTHESEDSKLIYLLEAHNMTLSAQLDAANSQIDALKYQLENFELTKPLMIMAENQQLKAQNIHLVMIKNLTDKVGRYTKGTKDKSKATQKKWNLAREYFKEEITENKTLKDARTAAAKRAGIYATERHLAEMLPNPNKNK